MTDPESGPTFSPSPEQIRAASGQFERAQQVVSSGNLDYAIRLLRSCCQLDPSNLIYRQTLRRTVRARYRNNLRGAWLAWLWNIPARLRLKQAIRQQHYLEAIEAAERVLARNPWDFGAQVDLGTAAEELGWLDTATWSLEQARSRQPQKVEVIEQLALLYEKQKNYEQASGLWRLIARIAPDHPDVASKLHHLAASETIQRGRYQQTLASGESLRTQRDDAEVSPDSGWAEAAEEHPRAREAEVLRQKVFREPQRKEHHLQLAALYRAIGDVKTATIVLQRGLEATNQAFELQAELEDLEIEPFRKLLAETEEALRESPSNQELRRRRAHLRKEINSRELALFEGWTQHAPREMRYQYELGVRLLRAGRTDDAIRALQQSREDARQRWQSLLFLGHCFRARNNPQLAIANFRDALKQMPASEMTGRKEALFLLANLLAESGDLHAAIEQGNELANLDFTFRDIGNLLDTWHAQVRNTAVSG